VQVPHLSPLAHSDHLAGPPGRGRSTHLRLP
jgi:hypothetical protein